MTAWRDRGGNAVGARTIGPVVLEASDQLVKLDAVINAAMAARAEASRENLFASQAGKILVNAMHDLTEVDGLYDKVRDISFELGEVESL